MLRRKLENSKFLERHSFDHVYTNPPYFIEENFSQPINKNKRAANIGSKKTIEKWLKKALTFSKSGGTITFINHIQNLLNFYFFFQRNWVILKLLQFFFQKR